MKANELRIGNWVNYFDDGNCSRISVLDHYYCHLNDASSIDYLMIKPIQLTEEWLLKFGFPEHKSTMDLLWNYSVCLERRHNELFVVNLDNIHVYQIEYVHELQNLVFALTGKELEIN